MGVQSYLTGGYTLKERKFLYSFNTFDCMLSAHLFQDKESAYGIYRKKYIDSLRVLWFLSRDIEKFWRYRVLDAAAKYCVKCTFSVICTLFCVFIFSFGPIFKLLNKLFELPIKILYRKK